MSINKKRISLAGFSACGGSLLRQKAPGKKSGTYRPVSFQGLSVFI
jgi:hypothetical protein